MNLPSQDHWGSLYKTKKSDDVSWYAPHLEKSLEIIRGLNLKKDARIIDIGGGASTLPDDLLAQSFKNITVLDISSEALEVSKGRLGNKANQICWLETDITAAQLKPTQYDLWHDRAMFHFLTKAEDRKKYAEIMRNSLAKGGYALIATFGSKGPLKCSGLETVRYSVEDLRKELGEGFELEGHFLEAHKTPFNTTQEFLYCLFSKT